MTQAILRKHVAVIHAYSQMSALQRKIINVLLHEAVNNRQTLIHQDSVATEYRTSYSVLCKKTNFNSNNTQYMKEAIDGLASLKIEWNLLKDRVPTNISFLNLRILHGSPTFYKDGTFSYSFHRLLLGMVNHPDIYGAIDLNVQCQFESKYGHSLYENCTRFVNLQKSKIIELETFRKLLGVNESVYPSMREFKRNVIKPAVEESNDRSDFVVNLGDIKLGRKVIAFELLTKSKKKPNPILLNEIRSHEHGEILSEIQKTFGKISEHVLNNILNNYSKEYIFEKIVYTKQYAKKETSGDYPIPYFISALRDDYKSNRNLQLLTEKTKREPPALEEWAKMRQYLILEVNHWEKQATNNTNANNLEINQQILSNCKKKLSEHLLKKPAEVEEV